MRTFDCYQVIKPKKIKQQSHFKNDSCAVFKTKACLFNCLTFSPQNQTSPQDDLDDPFIELRSDLEKLKSLGVDEYPEEVSPEEFASFDGTVAATEPVLSYESILAMVREVEEPIEVEDDEEEGDDTIGDQCLEKQA